MSDRTNTVPGSQRATLVSVLPAAQTMRAGGAELSAVEQQLIQHFRQMAAGSRTVIVGLAQKQASREREKRIAKNKPKFQVMQGGAR